MAAGDLYDNYVNRTMLANVGTVTPTYNDGWSRGLPDISGYQTGYNPLNGYSTIATADDTVLNGIDVTGIGESLGDMYQSAEPYLEGAWSIGSGILSGKKMLADIDNVKARTGKLKASTATINEDLRRGKAFRNALNNTTVV
jgi:hypothetical protein